MNPAMSLAEANWSQGADVTAIELSSGQHTPPEPQFPAPVRPPDQLTDVHSQRPGTEHCQQLQADDRQIRSAPPLVRLCIFLPQPRRRTCPVCTSIQPVLPAEEVDTR